MASDKSQLLQEALGPDEQVIWEGVPRPKRVHNAILVASALITAAFLWLGWSQTSPFAFWSPTLAKIFGTLVALVSGAFTCLMLLDMLNTRSTVVTNQRVLNINKLGGVSPQSGFPIDFTKECTIVERHASCDLDIPTVKIDHGYPDFYSVGGLKPDVAKALADTFKDLKNREFASKTDQ